MIPEIQPRQKAFSTAWSEGKCLKKTASVMPRPLQKRATERGGSPSSDQWAAKAFRMESRTFWESLPEAWDPPLLERLVAIDLNLTPWAKNEQSTCRL